MNIIFSWAALMQCRSSHTNGDVILSSRRLLKKTLGVSCQFLPHLQRKIDSGLTVFAFHDVSNEPSQFARQYGLVSSTATFERQVRWIQTNFEVIHSSKILANEPLPKRAAIISFDDGYLGTFENGLPILERLNLPSIIFLNMQPILESTPLLSAVACFLEATTPVFSTFCLNAGLQRPFHLTLNPATLRAYQHQYGHLDNHAIMQFQGPFANLQILKKWDSHPLVCYGNHLFEHWNATALTVEEFKSQYQNNESALASFANKVNLFAFTNGRPHLCFASLHLEALMALGAGKAFSTAKGINQDVQKFLQGRVALCEADNDHASLWFRIGRALFQREIII